MGEDHPIKERAGGDSPEEDKVRYQYDEELQGHEVRLGDEEQERGVKEDSEAG